MTDLEVSCVGIGFFLFMGCVLILCLFFDKEPEEDKSQDVDTKQDI